MVNSIYNIWCFWFMCTYSVASMLISCVTSTSDAMLQHLFSDCGLLDWIVQLPQSIVPTPLPGRHVQAAAKTPLRAGYLGHITHVAGALNILSQHRPSSGGEAGTSGQAEEPSSKVSKYTLTHEGWIKCVNNTLIFSVESSRDLLKSTLQKAYMHLWQS